MKTILLSGGFGYGNVGDEAQLASNIKLLKQEFPFVRVKVLSPNQEYTYKEHNGCEVIDASRVAFYDQGCSKLYSISNKKKGLIKSLGNSVFKLRFLFRSYWILLNAVFVKFNIPTIGLKSSRVALINEIKDASLVFIGGGGFFTGKTLSRLWDNVFYILVASILKVPVVMTGHTIGLWQNRFNKRLAKNALSKVEIVTTRDNSDSIQSLKDLELDIDKYSSAYDDALFSTKELDEQRIAKYLMRSGLQTDESYISYNMHYWGATTKKEKDWILNKNVEIISKLYQNYQKKILLIPMTPSDEEIISDFEKSHKCDYVSSLKYKYDFNIVRAIISRSDFCITMKHHPIIFALGEATPVIAISYSDYYYHKNGGALNNFEMDEFNVLFNEDVVDKTIRKCLEISRDRSKVIKRLEAQLAIARLRQAEVFNRMKRLLDE